MQSGSAPPDLFDPCMLVTFCCNALYVYLTVLVSNQGLLDFDCGDVPSWLDEYAVPRHQIAASGSSSFLGSGSHRYCTMRLPHRPMSTLFMFTILVGAVHYLAGVP